MTGDDLIIRGRKHSAMIGHWQFSKAVFFLLAGREPDAKEEALFDAMLTTVIDHGMGTASALATRFIQSTGNPLNAAVAGGILALGEYHGGAIEEAMRLFEEARALDSGVESFVKGSVEKKRLLHGFGHKVYKEADPRTRLLRERCAALSFDAPTLRLALDIEQEIGRQKGKRLVLNVDGAIAALLLDMGFPPEAGKGFFIIGRTPGLVAQAMEEREREKPVRRLDEEEIHYDGEERLRRAEGAGS